MLHPLEDSEGRRQRDGVVAGTFLPQIHVVLSVVLEQSNGHDVSVRGCIPAPIPAAIVDEDNLIPERSRLKEINNSVNGLLYNILAVVHRMIAEYLGWSALVTGVPLL